MLIGMQLAIDMALKWLAYGSIVDRVSTFVAKLVKGNEAMSGQLD